MAAVSWGDDGAVSQADLSRVRTALHCTALRCPLQRACPCLRVVFLVWLRCGYCRLCGSVLLSHRMIGGG
jgi:hypothetical protein